MISKVRKSRTPSAGRLKLIKSWLAEDESVSIPALAVELGVSEMTVRRDLEKLEQQSDIRRTHGGAVVAERMLFEFNYQERQRGNMARKKAIAAAARKQIEPGQRIILDTGTTTLELARLLKDCSGTTIITPSLAVASELQFSDSLSVILLGGVIHRGSPDLTGPVTEHSLELFSADWVFQGAEGIGEDGAVYNVDLQLAQVDRLMRRRATRKCLLADSSKLGRTALVKNGDIKDFDLFITDKASPQATLRRFRRMGTKILTA